ncbi:MAG TPA: alkaline phosphatase family protein, partial [Catalimonadaceae bacterium]|nr:alkaline phosphatase family protein [Catalimonadaceae bacterium]
FPYRLSEDGTSDYNIVFNSPFGNDITLLAATRLLKEEQLGKDNDMDFLSVSFSCTDVVGHDYGPFGIETEDTYLRLDRNLEALFKTLDKEVGAGNYLCFLTADHGILEVPAFLRSHKMPSDLFRTRIVGDSLKSFSQKTFGSAGLISSFINEQISLNDSIITALHLNRKDVIQSIIHWLEKQTNVRKAFAYEGSRPFPEPPFLNKYEAGYFKGRSGDIQIILGPGILESGSDKGTSHGSPFSYDSHVPCLWMGWKIKPGETMNPIQIQDIAPTLTSLLHIMEPNGCTGKPQTIPLKP